jgi:hypothetical protein
MAYFFPKAEATQYRGSVGLSEGRLDEFPVNPAKLTLAPADFAGSNLSSHNKGLAADDLPLFRGNSSSWQQEPPLLAAAGRHC